MEPNKTLVAIDIEIPADTPVKSSGTAYYRLDDGFLNFLKKCAEKHTIMGFEFDGGRNFGVILRDK